MADPVQAAVASMATPGPPVAPDLLDTLWRAADAMAAKIDSNERFRYILWLMDPSSSDERKRRIGVNLAWCDGIWQAYAERRALYLAHDRVPWYDWTPDNKPPYTFWDIAGA